MPLCSFQRFGVSAFRHFGVSAFCEMQTVVATVAATCPDGHALRLHKVTDDGCAARIKAVIKDLASDDSRFARFPGPNPVSLDTGHFGALRSQPYYVCEKTDGVRFMMVCCTLPCTLPGPDNQVLKVCALVDRALTAYVLPLRHVPKAMFQGSLLDGELVWNKVRQRWDYLVFDAVCVSGVPVLNDPLQERLHAAHRALAVYKRDPKDPVAVGIKAFVSCAKVRDLDAHLAEAEARYDVDGIILTPAMPGVVYGRHTGMFKLKFDSKHTVDFLVGPDGRDLQVFESGRHVSVGRLSCQGTPGTIAECCTAHPESCGTWDLVTVRTDKTTANDMLTYKRTLLNMQEGLTLDHVKRVFAAPPPPSAAAARQPTAPGGLQYLFAPVAPV